jgi:hypothetical protein
LPLVPQQALSGWRSEAKGKTAGLHRSSRPKPGLLD